MKRIYNPKPPAAGDLVFAVSALKTLIRGGDASVYPTPPLEVVCQYLTGLCEAQNRRFERELCENVPGYAEGLAAFEAEMDRTLEAKRRSRRAFGVAHYGEGK